MASARRGGRKGPSAADLLGHTTRVGADDALRSLVNQFSDPYSFLRELIQNSLDASSSQIEIDFEHDAQAGLATIVVADNGEGMNERVIDNYLLTLFSSTKERDLTKIGKFGIGFVSIFAIEPDLIVLETGQAGESWRIVFHPDARFEKLRIDEPVEGTLIRLHKRASAGEFEQMRQRGRQVVRYWCKFAEADITVDGTLIREPFGVSSPLCVHHVEPGSEIVLGLPPLAPHVDPDLVVPRLHFQTVVGFYNRGLTLIESDQAPKQDADLAGLSFRIKSRYLEHTLTRDNVLQDENYDKALALLREQVSGKLRPALRAHVEALARHLSGGTEQTDPGAPDFATSLIYARLPAMGLAQHAPEAPIFPTTDGEPLSVSQLKRIKTPVGSLLTAEQRNPLTRALAAQGVPVLLAVHGLAAFLKAECDLAAVAADEMLLTALPLETDARTRALLEQVAVLINKAGLRVGAVALGQLAYPGARWPDRLCLRQQQAFGVSGPHEQPTLFGGARQLVLNGGHALTQRCHELARDDLPLASLLLAQGICAEQRADVAELSGLACHSLALDATRWSADER